MSLERKKREVELMRVRVAREELELKIAERDDEIVRLRQAIEVQNKAEENLLNILKEMEGK